MWMINAAKMMMTEEARICKGFRSPNEFERCTPRSAPGWDLGVPRLIPGVSGRLNPEGSPNPGEGRMARGDANGQGDPTARNEEPGWMQNKRGEDRGKDTDRRTELLSKPTEELETLLSPRDAQVQDIQNINEEAPKESEEPAIVKEEKEAQEKKI